MPSDRLSVSADTCCDTHTHTHMHNRFTVPWIVSGTTRVNRYQKGKTNLDLLDQEIVSGSDISWAYPVLPEIDFYCMQEPQGLFEYNFYRPAIPNAEATASKG